MAKTKEQMLSLLEQHRGEPLSGAAAAKMLGLSRAAVWKAIEELRKEGYAITAVTNRGYRLSETNDLLSAEGIFVHCADLPITKEQIHVEKVVDSTNRLARMMAVEGAAHGSVFLAEEQTQGRGRRGRSFFSPNGKGLYMSILLRPTGTSEQAVLTTTAASVAVCRALQETLGIEAKIKWVNDLFWNDKKICGILTEAVTDVESGTIESLVLGIGINTTSTEADFPLELRKIAGSVFADSPVSRNVLAAAVLAHVFAIAEAPIAGEFMEEYRARSLVLGREITVHSGTETYPAKAIDIDSAGALIAEKKDGTRILLNSGEVSIRPIID